jgi:hypothetical protein
VTRSGTISVRNVLYTVPSRLVGCRVKVHIYDDRLVCYLGTTPVLTVARRYFKRNGPPQRVVDYRHLIGPLIRKPQAFRHSVFRDELFPSSVFRHAWETLDQRLDPRKACRVYVGLLHLAAMQGCEAALADHLAGVLRTDRCQLAVAVVVRWRCEADRIGVVIRLRPTIAVIFPASLFRFGEERSAIRVPTTVVIVRDEVRHACASPAP